MRPFETYVMYLAMYVCLGQVYFKFYATIALLAALLGHVASEGPRIQMTPAYLVSLYYVQAALLGVPEPPSVGWFSWLLTVSAAQGILWATAAFACLMPVARLPAPSGPYATIGTVRAPIDFEPASDASGDGVWVKFFYPSSKAPTAGMPAKYTSWQVARSVASALRLPGLTLHHASLGTVPAMEGAPMAQGEEKFPVLVFSHGLGLHPDLYSTVAMELASHGYLIALVLHTDESAATATRLDGSVVRMSPVTTHEAQLAVRVAQLQAVVAALQRVNKAGSILSAIGIAGRLDLAAVGLYGHGLGATTAFVAAQDEGIKACALHDLLPSPLAGSADTLALPVLSIQSQDHCKSDIEAVLSACVPAESTCILLQDTKHYNFIDLFLYGKMLGKRMGLLGSLDARRALDIVNLYDLAYFNARLKGDSSMAQKLQEGSPEVPSEVWFQKL